MTDRQTTDGRAMTYSERKREFTFAKNYFVTGKSIPLWNQSVRINWKSWQL